MQAPRPGKVFTTLETNAFQLHRFFGMITLFLLASHWLWTFSGHVAGGFGNLFPWSSRKRVSAVLADLKPLFEFRWRDLPRVSAAAGAFEGFGLVVASLMALTGSFLFFGISPDGRLSESVRIVKKVHESIASLMWIYLACHAMMGFLHQWLGHRSVSDMFNLRRK